MVKIVDKSDLRLAPLISVVLDEHAPCVRYQGNVYLIVKKADSQHTGLRVTQGFIPLMNVKSHTMRAVCSQELVEPLNAEIVLTPWVGEIEHG